MPVVDRASVTAGLANLLARRTSLLDTELCTLPDLIRPGDVCVDVGSAAGLYCQAMSYLAGPTGRVHSIEPVTFSHPFWTRVLGAQRRGNVRHHALALGPEPGRAAMRVPYDARGPATSRSFLDWQSHGLGSNAEYPRHADVEVEVQTLDGLCEAAGLARLDFVKIDVEGGELHVLHGAERAVERFHPTMLVEIEARHTDRYSYTPADIVDWLTARGYRMYAWRDGWRPADTVCVHANNYLFRPAD
ncbi:FkbM family methyltransferase [Actinocatenispora rupis]|uniref:Putative methyltransferase n=1 Tax=Actinocatenispora rupis TaxID=519421 RepID=A0A8J3NDX4_9ACTN|nr:FkbM family methyltransferase [Actinocatenispora rupis]GID15739.1 putative methyltransferase [Actinocatenispora rupis]